MGNAAILSPHLSDAASITVSSEVATLPGQHLQTLNAWQLWRATTNWVRIVVEFTAVVEIDAAFMAGLVASAGARWKHTYALSVVDLEYNPDVALDWTLIDGTGAIDGRLYPGRRSFVRYAGPVVAGAMAVEIYDPGNGGVLEAWRLGVGKLFQPAGNIDQQLGRPIDSADVQEGRFGGGRSTGARGRGRGASFSWSNLTRAEADALQDIGMLRGNWGDVLFILDPADATRLQRDSVLGPFALGSPDISDVEQFSDDDLQMSRAAVRVIEANT